MGSEDDGVICFVAPVLSVDDIFVFRVIFVGVMKYDGTVSRGVMSYEYIRIIRCFFKSIIVFLLMLNFIKD